MSAKILRTIKNWVIIPFTLLLLSTILVIVYFINSSVNTNVLPHNESDKKLLQRDNFISGEFQATDDHLSIITLRFNNKYRTTNSATFRIKQSGAKKWWHTAEISTAQFYAMPEYSFGFPTISKSNGKWYQFEIRLNSGAGGINLGSEEPVFVSNYAYPKDLLSSDLGILTKFIVKKTLNYIDTPLTGKVILVYSLPLLLYVGYMLIVVHLVSCHAKQHAYDFLRILSKPSIAVILIAFGIDIFIIRKFSDSIIIGGTALWIVAVISHQIPIYASFILGLLFLFFCPIMLWAHMEWIADKSAAWTYVMLAVGIAQSVINSSPLIQKIMRFELVRIAIQLIRYFFLSYDRLLAWLLRNTKQRIIAFLTSFFEIFPTTFLGWIIFIAKSIFLTISIVMVFVASLYIIKVMNDIVITFNHTRTRLSINPTIEAIEPKLVYKGINVVIYGNEFGWDQKKSHALIDGEVIGSASWSNTKIVFPVPLHWKTGYHTIWIEKKMEWDGEKIITKSKKFTIKVLPIGQNFTEDDKLYFEQLKELRKETLELNGYTQER